MLRRNIKFGFRYHGAAQFERARDVQHSHTPCSDPRFYQVKLFNCLFVMNRDRPELESSCREDRNTLRREKSWD
jgi:hypothetical protein